jgi:hypothetical protein
MRWRQVVIFLCGVLVTTGVFAQSDNTSEQKRWFIGLEWGYAHNMLYSSTGYRAFTQYENGAGFSIGIPAQFRLFDWLTLGSGLQYIQKNYALSRSVFGDDIRSEWTNSYLELPLMARFSFGGEKLRGFLNTGVYIGLWLDSHIKGTALRGSDNYFEPAKIYYESYDETVPMDNRRDNQFEAGLLVGAGLQYRLENKIMPCIFFLEGRFYYGLTDMQKNYMLQMTPRINDTISIQMGVLLNLF